MDWDPRDNIDETKKFGVNEFSVRHFKGLPGYWGHGDYEGQFFPYGTEPRVTEYWTVSLPHQCDDWDIDVLAEGEACDAGHGRTVAALELFIAEAQQALEALRQMR